MTIVSAAFTNGDGGSGSSFATASKTWVLNRMYYISVMTYLSGGSVLAPTSVTGSTLVKGQATAGGTITRADVYRFLGDGSTGTKTIDYSGVTQSRCQWAIDEVTGMDITGTNGSGSVVQSTSDSNISSTLSATLAAFGDAVNNAAWAFGFNNGANAETVKAGYTLTATNSGFLVLANEYLVGQDTAPNMTQAGSSAWSFIALEIKAAGGGGASPLRNFYPGPNASSLYGNNL